MVGNEDFLQILKKKYLKKKLPSMKRVKETHNYSQTCFGLQLIEEALCALKTGDSLMQLKGIAESSNRSFLQYFWAA